MISVIVLAPLPFSDTLILLFQFIPDRSVVDFFVDVLATGREKYARLVQERANQTHALDRSRRKCADLAVQGVFQVKLFRQGSDALHTRR